MIFNYTSSYDKRNAISTDLSHKNRLKIIISCDIIYLKLLIFFVFSIIEHILFSKGEYFMNQRIKLFIADGDKSRLEMLTEYLSDNSVIELCGTASDGTNACILIKRHKPDVVILNMMLSSVDGLGVIENINNSLQQKPKIICISSIQNDFMIQQAFALGASYFATLPIETAILVQRVTDVCNSIPVHTQSLSATTNTTSQSSVEEQTKSILLAIGIPANIKGYPYLCEAVSLAVKNREIVNKITKELYPEIAKKFNTTASKVERAVRHAIDVAWNRGKIKNMNEIFGIEIFSPNEKPTNGEFVALMADRITSSASASRKSR